MNETESGPPIVRPNPSEHWSDVQRHVAIEWVRDHPDHDGIWHHKHGPRKFFPPPDRFMMCLAQLEREGHLLFTYTEGVGVWSVTPSGMAFVAPGA